MSMMFTVNVYVYGVCVLALKYHHIRSINVYCHKLNYWHFK